MKNHYLDNAKKILLHVDVTFHNTKMSQIDTNCII